MAKSDSFDPRSKSRSLRKSCNFCHNQKKKCDGDGVNSCSECTSRRFVCEYGRRRPRTPKPQQAASAAQSGSWIAEITGGGTPIKRAHMGPSLATGLVGTEENQQLAAYFKCVSILPWASESAIRKAMMSIILSLQEGGSRRTSRKISCSVSPTRGICAPGLNAQALATATEISASTFWSAVALGGILLGKPLEKVNVYVNLANEALRSNSQEKSEQLARGCAVLAYVKSHTGAPPEEIEGLIREAQSTVSHLLANDPGSIPEDFKGLLHQMDIFCDVSTENVDWAQDDTEDDVKLENVFTVQTIYRHFSKFHNRLAKLIMGETNQAPQQAQGHGQAPAWELGTGPNPGGYPLGHISFAPGAPMPASTASRLSDSLKSLLQEHVHEIEWLKIASSRPEVRQGLGEVSLNIVKVFLSIVGGDYDGVLEASSRCMSVLTHYPGLCRFRGCGVVHVVMVVVAALQRRDLYEQYREAFDPLRPEGSPPLPPMERMWEAVVCDRFMCTSLIMLFKTKAHIFSPGPHRQAANTVRGGMAARTGGPLASSEGSDDETSEPTVAHHASAGYRAMPMPGGSGEARPVVRVPRGPREVHNGQFPGQGLPAGNAVQHYRQSGNPIPSRRAHIIPPRTVTSIDPEDWRAASRALSS